jgi:hypothetical protein
MAIYHHRAPCLHINKETGFDLLTENHGPPKVPGHFQGVVVPTLRMKLQTEVVYALLIDHGI